MNTVMSLRQGGDIRDVVAGEIRAWMARRGVNQTMLAHAIGLTQSQISKRLKGTIPINIVELEQIADYLEVDVPTLLGGAPLGPPGGPAAAGSDWRARRDSNPKPSDPKVLGLRTAA